MHRAPFLQSAWFVLLSPFWCAVPASAQCLEWDSSFAMPGPQGPAGGAVWTFAIFDDGSGPALFAGGDFTTVDGQPANHVAKWDGSAWSPLGSGLDAPAYASVVFNDGTGPALFVAGAFATAGGAPASRIAKWNGSGWSSLGGGGGGIDGTVDCLAVFDDGTGPALFVGGSFADADGTAVNNVAKWNGTSWSALGTGTDASVLALAVFDDGSGSKLYAGGTFANAGGASAERIARWNGTAWSTFGGLGSNGQVQALAVHDDGSGSALYVAGLMFTAGGVSVNNIARFRGVGWSAVGSGLNLFLFALLGFDDGSGPALYASGLGGSSDQVAKWNGSSWSFLGAWPHPIGSATGSTALAAFDAGTGAELHAGILWQNFPEYLPGLNLARWNGARWSPVGASAGISGGVASLAVFDEDKSPELFAGGPFTLAGANYIDHIARWDGASWQPVGEGTNGPIRALALFDTGTSRTLLAGGTFSQAGGTSVSNLAAWDGAAWQSPGGGVDGNVTAMTSFQDGSGPALYLAGAFTTAGGVAANHIARWDGSTWSQLGSGVSGTVEVLGVFDDGSGPALYVGGSLTSAGGISVANLAKWNGTSWSALGSGTNGPVYALASFDDGSGPALFVGGSFSLAGPVSSNDIARWDGSTWSRPGGVSPPFINTVTALLPFDDGSGPALYVAQEVVFPEEASRIFTWNGASWSQPFAIDEGNVHSIAVLDDGSDGPDGSPDLYFGGDFLGTTLGIQSMGVAQWLGCGHPGERFCFGDGSGAACPCGNTGTSGHGCENSAGTGGALLDSSGWASLRYDSLRLTATGERPTALSVFFQGDARISPHLFGDGLRCVGGHLKRMYVKSATGGTVSAPQSGNSSLSAYSAQLGDPLSPGRSRYYQVYYRDPAQSFCPTPTGNTWNVTNALRINWEL